MVSIAIKVQRFFLSKLIWSLDATTWEVFRLLKFIVTQLKRPRCVLSRVWSHHVLSKGRWYVRSSARPYEVEPLIFLIDNNFFPFLHLGDFAIPAWCAPQWHRLQVMWLIVIDYSGMTSEWHVPTVLRCATKYILFRHGRSWTHLKDYRECWNLQRYWILHFDMVYQHDSWMLHFFGSHND